MKGAKPKHSGNHSHQEQDTIVLPTLSPQPQSFKSKNNQEQGSLLGTTEGLVKSLQLAHLGSWEWDIPAHKITWSPEIYRIYDIDPQAQLNYDELMERVHPEDRDYYKTVVRDWTKNRQGSSFEYRILCSDGSIRFVHGETEVFCDDAGNPNRIFGVIQDITERKRAEEELGKHHHHLELLVREWTTEFTKTNSKLAKEIIRREHVEDKLLKEKNFSETAINSLPGIFYLIDEQGRIIRYNRNAEKVTGYSGEEFINLTAYDLLAEADRETMTEKMREVFTSGEATMEAGLLTKDKKKISYFFTGSKMYIDNKKYIVGMGIDITQRKRMEESLRESEEKLRSMFDNMQDISYRTDKEGKVIWISPSATYMLGYESIDELLGCNLAKDLYTSPEQRQMFLEKLSEKGIVTDYEVELNKKDGSTIIVSTNSHYYRDKEGEIAGVEGVCRDVTERKRAEDELRARQKRFRKKSKRAARKIT
jgi:PAS domain S-box-containing protein